MEKQIDICKDKIMHWRTITDIDTVNKVYVQINR